MVDAGGVEMALADGEDPSGRAAVVNMAEAKELRKLAALHSIQKPFWLVLDDQEELEFNDESVCPKDQTVKKKVYFEKTGPHTRLVLQEQKAIKVEETLEPVELVAIRLTLVKEFTDPAVWKAARRNGQRVLDMVPSLKNKDVRTFGWQGAEISKNDTVLMGYEKMANGTEQVTVNDDRFSTKALITAERLKFDAAFPRQKV